MLKTSDMILERYGRSYHLRIETVEDLGNVVKLDAAHWVATAAPVEMLNCDKTFLELLDSDNTGRIMCHEVKDAIRWLLELLCDRTGITEHSERMRLDAINADTPEGPEILSAAKEVLSTASKKDAEEVTLEQVRRGKTRVESTPVSEAGVVLPEAAKEARIQEFIRDVIKTVGGAEHPSGAQGVGSAQLASFIEAAGAYLKWYEKGQVPAGQDRTDIMPLGCETASAYGLFASIRGKLDQYFAQCVALALDERFETRMGWTEAELRELDFDDPAAIEQVLQKAPLARATADEVLGFDDHINPYYSEVLEHFREQVARPVLAKVGAELSAEQWQQIKAFFAAHDHWLQAKAGAAVESLGVEKQRKYLDDRFADAVQALISDSRRTASALDKIRLLEKAILYQAHMIEFVNNFVSFPQLYDTNSRAMFEMGSLVMGGRRFNLAVRVGDRAQHKMVAGSSSMYVLYVDITGADGNKTEAAVPVTSGGKGNLSVGKRGVFYDIFGNECDARVVDIITNPISIGEALVSPFQRLGKLLVGKFESITTAAEKKLDATTSSTLDRMTSKPAGGQPAAAAGRPPILGGGLLMGAGVAVAALGSAMAYVTKTLAEIHAWAVVVGVLAAVLAVMVPISIVAFLKLRRRDLSAILEGSGWAINAPMRLTHKQSRYFAQVPRYPKGSKGVHRLCRRLALVGFLLLAVIVGAVYLLKRQPGGRQPSAEPPRLSQPAEKESTPQPAQ